MSTDDTNRDNWLHALRTNPSPEFKDELRSRLREQETTSHVSPRRQWSRALLGAAAVVVGGALFAVPAVRASVAQFVSLFRVGQIEPIQVNASNLDRLEDEAAARGINYLYNVIPDAHPDQSGLKIWLMRRAFVPSQEGGLLKRAVHHRAVR